MRLVLILLLISSTALGQVDLNLGLKAYYPFSGNPNDVSGNNNNPVFNNASLTADRFGNPNSAYHFNGTDNYMRIPNSPSLNSTNKVSISAWVRPTGFYGGTCHGNAMVMKGNDDFSPGKYKLRFDDAAFTNGTNCTNPVIDPNHENFFGNDINLSPPGYSPYIQPNQWYHVVVTSDGITTKLYVDCQLKVSKPQTTLSFTNMDDLFFGAMNHPSFPYWLNGDLDEIRIYNRAISADEIKVLGGCLTLCPPQNDFSYTQQICSPYTVLFTTPATGFSDIRWDFGDGAYNATGSTTVTHTYGASGSYVVTMTIDYPSCSDIISKTVTVDVQQDDQLITTHDTLYCSGLPKQLLSNGGLDLCWSPSDYLDDPHSPNPITTTTQDITYYLTSLVTGSNLVVNGNFSAGNTGFTSQYVYTPNNTTAGEYFVGTNPSAWYFAHFPCIDHTTGNGNMMMVNGADIANVEVWKTNLAVTPNTNYAFSTWISSISAPNPAQLAFSINGSSVGALINANPIGCTWTQFYTVWNSGSNTSATISILNKNTLSFGNDFALDDISFAPVKIKRDSVKIQLEKPVVITNENTSICVGAAVQLNTTGAITYSWSPVTGLSNPAIPDPIATPLITTQYIVTGTSIHNCIAKDTVLITVTEPTVRTNDNTNMCAGGSVQLNTTGAGSYLWSPMTGLSNPFIANPVAAPLVTTQYIVTGTISANCTGKDTVLITVLAKPLVTITNDTTICNGTSLQLMATGGSSYQWSPAATLNDPAIPGPIANPSARTKYYVTVTDDQHCSAIDSVTVDVRTVNNFSISPPANLCKNSSLQLQASGGDLYSWSPAISLSNPAIAGPIASPSQTTLYSVLITDTLCHASATLSTTITVLPLPIIKATRSNDIDCSNNKSFLAATGGVSYSWTPTASLDNPVSANPVASPFSTTKYIVAGKDPAGCVNYDSVTVVMNGSGKAGYLMPSGFTPNNDGKNDCYGIRFWGSILELEFSIYNRSGERVFHSTTPGDCWDGRYKGAEQNPGVFIYMIKAKTVCEPSVFRKGTFLLIR